METINIFVSYSHKDANWVSESDLFSLIPWLESSLHKANVNIWFDRVLKRLPGEEYKKKIKSEIDSAHIAILLISQDFANSDFISEYELPWIKERVEGNELIVVPILVGPTLFSYAPHLKWICERQILPGEPTPLIDYTNDKPAFFKVRLEILEAIRNRIDQLRNNIQRERVKRSGKTEDTPNALIKPVGPRRRKSLIKWMLITFIPIIILAIVGILFLKQESGDLKSDDLKTLEKTADEYAMQICKNPFIAVTEKENLRTFAQRLSENKQFENELPRSAAIIYRLYAASLLLTQSQSIIDQTQQSLPWLQKSLELYTGFEDIKELKDSKNFFNEMVTRQMKDVDAGIYIRHNIRVAMIEATEEEVNIMAEQILEKIIAIKKGE